MTVIDQGLAFAGLERIRDLSSSAEALRCLERVTALHQRALKASKDLDVIEVFPQVLILYASHNIVCESLVSFFVTQSSRINCWGQAHLKQARAKMQPKGEAQ